MKKGSREFLKLDVVLSRTWGHRDLGFVSTDRFHLKGKLPRLLDSSRTRG